MTNLLPYRKSPKGEPYHAEGLCRARLIMMSKDHYHEAGDTHRPCIGVLHTDFLHTDLQPAVLEGSFQ